MYSQWPLVCKFVNLNTAYRREQGPIVIPAEPKKEPPKQGYSVYGSPDINYSALYTSQPPSKNGLGPKNRLPLPHVPLLSLQPVKNKISPKDRASSGRENPYLAFQRYIEQNRFRSLTKDAMFSG